MLIIGGEMERTRCSDTGDGDKQILVVFTVV